MDDTISSHVRRCLGLFSLPCFSDLAQAVPPEKLVLLKINDQQTRFKVWSGSIGAHRDGTSSLDYRLRDASGIRLQVVRLLQDLSELLRDGCEILSGNKTPWDQLDDEECSDLEEEAPGTDDMPETELEQIKGDVEEVVDCLIRLSMTIRNPAPYDRFKSFRANDTTYFEKFDIEHVQSKFSSLDRRLAERLGKSNSGRRQYFKYREDHYKKLSHDIEQVLLQDPEVEAPHTVASSVPSHLKDDCRTGLHAPAIFEDDASDAGVSQTSYATSLGDARKLRVPSLPAEAHKGPFKCPFCHMWIVAITEMAWKKHVYSDLRPYICLEEDCTHPTHEYSRRHQWMDHMKENHWKVYRCMHGCDLAFSSITKCKDHIMHCHGNTAPGPELDALIKLTAEPMDISAGISCPLCQETLTSTSQYQRHVGRHQEQISLFALPTIEPDEDSESDKDESEDESVHGASVSASANSTDNEAPRTFPDDTKGPEDSTSALDSLKWDAKDIESRYCLCQTHAATDDMVACQSEKCLNKLFHMSCVGLLIEPKGVWFCPVCIDNMDQRRSRTTGISRPSSRDKESRLQEDQDREDMEPGERLPEELFYRPEHIEWEQGMYPPPREDNSESNLDQDHKGSFFPAAASDAVAVNARDRETATPLTAPINIEVGGAKINWHSGAQTNRSQTQSLAHESKDRPSRYNIPEERHASSEDQEPGMIPAPNQISKSDTHPTPVDTNLGFAPYPSKAHPKLRERVACVYCRKRKIRCSGYSDSPGGKCTNCKKMGKECVFKPVPMLASTILTPASTLPGVLSFESPSYGALGRPLPGSYLDDDPPEHYYRDRDFKPVASSASKIPSEPDKPFPWQENFGGFYEKPLSGHQDGQPPLQYSQDPGETSYPYPSDGWIVGHPELLKSINESQVSQTEPANVEAAEQGVHTTTVAASVGSGPSRWVDDNFRPDNISWPLTDNMISGGDAELLSGTSAAYCCSVPDCLKLFDTPSELKKHENTHIKPFKCHFFPACPTRKATKRDLNRHYYAAHKDYARALGIRLEESDCPECGKQFTRKDNLERHMKWEHNLGENVCPNCGEHFTRDNLKRHLRTVHNVVDSDNSRIPP